MYGTDYFQIIHGDGWHVGELIATGIGALATLEKGTCMDRLSTTLSTPGNGDFVGLLSKQVTPAGPTFQQMTLGDPDLPAQLGQAVSLYALDDGAEIEVEGEPNKQSTDATKGLLVTAGTGAITAATPSGTEVSCKNGRWYIAQVGDFVMGELQLQLTPIADPVNNIRVMIEIRRGKGK